MTKTISWMVKIREVNIPKILVACRFTLSLPVTLTPINSWQFWVSIGWWWQKGGGKFLKRRKTRWKGVSRLGCRFSRSFCRFTLLLPLVPLFKPLFKCCLTVTWLRLICCLFSCAKRRKICSCIAPRSSLQGRAFGLWGEGVLPYIGYISMCGTKGYGFSAIFLRLLFHHYQLDGSTKAVHNVLNIGLN